MGYFNYHAKAKRLIKEGKLIDIEVVEKHNHISPALLLIFNDALVMPIREHKWQEYFLLLKEHYPHLL